MTSNKRYFLNTPQPFNNINLWKARFRIFIQIINCELWETIMNGPFIHAYQVNGEVVNKPYFLWTEEEKRKFEINFKTKSFIIMSLDGNKFFRVNHCKIAKEKWNTLEMIYRVSSSIEQEEMDTQGEENEDIIH